MSSPGAQRAKGKWHSMFISQGKVDGKRSRGKCFEDEKVWTGLSSNDTWRGPEDHVAQRKRCLNRLMGIKILEDLCMCYV